jgi:phenylalanyl-tRNA synthetase beta chain
MKFTLSWLREHLETDASLDAIVEALTRVGLEVESVENPAEKLGAFTIAKVLTAERHPQADKLRRAQCAGRAGGRVRRTGNLCSGLGHHAQDRGHPGRREPGDDVLDARA